MRNALDWFISEESGQGLVEYGLIIALISVALILVLGNVTEGLKATFNKITTSLGGTVTP